MLRYLRKREGLSQVELAKKTGISRSRINNYENGIREPDLETMETFADYFNVNMDTLTGREFLKPNQFIELESINSEELAMIKRYRKAIEKDKEKILLILKEYSDK